MSRRASPQMYTAPPGGQVVMNVPLTSIVSNTMNPMITAASYAVAQTGLLSILLIITMILAIVQNSKLGVTVTNSVQKLGLWVQILNIIAFFVVLLTFVPTLLGAAQNARLSQNSMYMFWILIVIFLASIVSSISISSIQNNQAAPQIAKTDAALAMIFNIVAVALLFWSTLMGGRFLSLGLSGYKMALGA